MIIPIFKKGDCKQCRNYKGVFLLGLPGKAYAKCLERKCREIVESKLEEGQCSFHPDHSTQARSQKFAIGGAVWGGWGRSPLALENFAFFCKINLILEIF